MSELAPHKLYPPHLMGDDRGGNVAPQNILLHNVMTGEKSSSHMATPAPEDPCDPINVLGAFRVRKEKQKTALAALPRMSK